MELIEAWRITEAQYNNLLPVMRKNLHARRFVDGDEYSFVGTHSEYLDAQTRCAFL